MKRNKLQKSSTRNGTLEWFFPTTDHGENDGFSDSLLEYFQGNHERFIARETIQNSIDARLDYEKPVLVSFERLSMPASEIPGSKELLSRINKCLSFIKGQDKAEEFFKKSIALFEGKEISVLKISDFNTRGLSGSDDDVNGNWYRLVRASGTSSPKGAEGGSFGIGKGAPFAASKLRTVFYSSVNDKQETVFQGKARLVSHFNDKKDVRQGVGFYGVEGYKAVRNIRIIPNFFKRETQGTDIFIMGYQSDNGWEEKLIKSVLHNFWLAIMHGDLEISIKGGSTKKISKENIAQFLDQYDSEDAKFYYDSVTNWTQKFEKELFHLGKVSLYVKKAEDYPSKIMMARKPKMMVKEKQYRVLREPYAGVFLCDDDKGNSLLKDLEPPKHDEWDKDRSKLGVAILNELNSWIKESLKEMGESMSGELEDIPGLDKYLPDSDEREDWTQNKDSTEFSKRSADQESGREISAQKEVSEAEIETITRKGLITKKVPSSVNPTPPHDGQGNGSLGRPTGSEEGKESGIRIKTSNISFRSFVQKSKEGIEYRLIVTGREDCEGGIKLIAVGDDNNYPAEVESAKNIASGANYDAEGAIINGLSIRKGDVLKIAVRLKSGEKYKIGIENYEG